MQNKHFPKKRSYITDNISGDINNAILEGFENIQNYCNDNVVVTTLCDLVNDIDGLYSFSVSPNDNESWQDVIGSNYNTKDIIFDIESILEEAGFTHANKDDYFIVSDLGSELYTTSDILDLPNVDRLLDRCVDQLKPAIESIRNSDVKNIFESCFEKALRML